MTVVGNHGVEPHGASRRLLDRVHRWRPILEAGLAGLPGVKIEDKGFSVSVHYRQSREKKNARAAILGVARRLGEVRVIGGLQVVNILPKGSPHKGTAFQRECERLGCDAAIFVGDDDTDEDAFALEQPAKLAAIRIGAKAGSAAAYCIPSQGRIDELLGILIRLRGERSAGRKRG